MIDSTQQAQRDAKISSFDYQEGVFRQFFTTPFEQYAEHIGKQFEVVKQTRPGQDETDKQEAEDDMYLIRFLDGLEIDTFGHEVCVLNYDKCLPKIVNHAEGDLSDSVYHACLDKWDEVRKGLDEEDAASILISVTERLKYKIERDEEYACQRNAEKMKAKPKV